MNPKSTSAFVNRCTKIQTHNLQNRGFAVVLSLSMMSFVVLLLLSLTTLISVETSNADRSVKQILARENARLGMLIAVGNVQKLAGPDQKITARAEILGDGNFNLNSKFWTGLWDSDLAGGVNPDPQWLVSGNNQDPLTGPTGSSIEIFPETANEAAVRVSLVQIDQNSPQAGDYAFWVSDEGVKASLTARREAVATYNDPGLSAERRATEYQAAFGVGLDSFFVGVDLDLNNEDFANSLKRVFGFDDLPVLKDSSNNPLIPVSGEFIETRHNLTTVALGVIENPANGGLKKNLSDTGFRDSFLATDETQEFLSVKGGVMDVESGLPSRRSFSGKPYHSPRPLLTEVVLYIGLFHTDSDGKLRIRYHVEAEFTNPYSLPLRFPADADAAYDRGVVLLFDNLPTITVEDTASPTTTPAVTENLNAFSAYSAFDSRRTINSWFEISPLGTPDVPVLNPGEVYRVLEPDPLVQKRGIARDFGTDRWSDNQNTKPEDDSTIQITAIHPTQGVTLTVVPYSPSGSLASRPPISRFEELQFDDFVIQKTFNSGTNPFSRLTSSTYEREDYLFAYHFRVKSDDTDLSSMKDIMTALDLRDPDLNASEQFTDIEGVQKDVSSILEPSYTDPSFIIQDDSNLFSLLDQIMDPTGRSHANDYRDAFLYDMPDGEVLSVGQLSSLHIYRRSPRSIGSPWGSTFNEAFDQYYFSPKIINPANGDPMLASPAILGLENVDLDPDEDDAAKELIVGSFNINSTSIEAWESVLSSPILTPEALDENLGGSTSVTRSAAFFRLPQYQARTDDFFVTANQIQSPDRFFEQGIRSLHGDDGTLQLRQLAENIVLKIQERGMPFSDMVTFVNSGLIRDAVDDVGQTNGGGGIPQINEDIMEFSNVFLTQNDILTKIAPQATTRSDTFKIHAYGATTDPVTGDTAGEVWCEAVIQRLPEKIDGSDPMTPATSDNLRQFRIISVRFLADEPS